jgi:hypothetical protein
MNSRTNAACNFVTKNYDCDDDEVNWTLGDAVDDVRQPWHLPPHGLQLACMPYMQCRAAAVAGTHTHL